MKEYWIDFSGYLKVEAENADEAERKFWHAVNTQCGFCGRDGFSDVVWDLGATEEVSNDIYNGWHKENVVDFLLDREGTPTFDNPNAPTLQDIEDFWNDK